MVEGQKTNRNNDALIVSVQVPYTGVIEVNGYTLTVKGETKELYYKKEFRWSTDGILYTDWKELTTQNLQSLLLDSTRNFYPQYKFTQVGDGELEFVSIALEIMSVNGTINSIPLCGFGDNSTCCGQQNLVFECCNEGFNPYAIGNSAYIYNQLCQVVSNMFGFCVPYFKTSADQRSRDVILHEYSLLHVIQQGNIKLLVPDNQLPTREIQFNPLQMDYPVTFEVHIVKSAFQEAFGAESKPEVGDYLYFETYMNRMYEVNGVSETDDFMYSGAYWRVSLTPYQKRSEVKFDEPQIELDTETLIFNTDKFNIEVEKQEKDVRKQDQYNTVGKLENDYARRILDKKLVIEATPIYNNWTMISKSYYALKSIPNGSVAVQYRYDKGWGGNEERMLTFWIRPKYDSALHTRLNVAGLFNADGKLGVRLDNVGRLKEGMCVKLIGTDYAKMQKVVGVDEENLTAVLNTKFKTDAKTETARLTPYTTNEFFKCGDAFSISQSVHSINIDINGNTYSFDLCDDGKAKQEWNGLVAGEWNAVILMVKPSERKVGLWVYHLGSGTQSLKTMDSTIDLAYYKTVTAKSDITVEGDYWTLYACDLDLTNLRIWNQMCEELNHNLILSQYVVKDSHLCELVDNAQPELLLDKVTNPR